jgi:hypothetical protein
LVSISLVIVDLAVLIICFGFIVSGGFYLIQIDMYILESDDGTSTAFLDSLNKFKDQKTIFDNVNMRIQYNNVISEAINLNQSCKSLVQNRRIFADTFK